MLSLVSTKSFQAVVFHISTNLFLNKVGLILGVGKVMLYYIILCEIYFAIKNSGKCIFLLVLHSNHGNNVSLIVNLCLASGQWALYYVYNFRMQTEKNMILLLLKLRSFIVHCSCVAVSCSGRISVSAPTTALRYCKEVNLRCSMLCWAAVDK